MPASGCACCPPARGRRARRAVRPMCNQTSRLPPGRWRDRGGRGRPGARRPGRDGRIRPEEDGVRPTHPDPQWGQRTAEGDLVGEAAAYVAEMPGDRERAQGGADGSPHPDSDPRIPKLKRRAGSLARTHGRVTGQHPTLEARDQGLGFRDSSLGWVTACHPRAAMRAPVAHNASREHRRSRPRRFRARRVGG